MTSPVTVVIPTLNRPRLTAEAVESARALPGGVADIIVVDTGSGEDSLDELRQLVPGCRLIEGHYPNQAAARNVGARRVETDAIAFLDSDDRYLPRFSECLLPALESDPKALLVAGRIEVIDVDGSPDPDATANIHSLYEKALAFPEDYEGVARSSLMYTSATLVRKAAFDAVGGYDEAVPAGSEDWDLYLRLAAIGTIRTLPCPVAEYRVWPNNTSWYRHAHGVAEVAQKHLRGLPGVSDADRERADLYLRAHLVFSLHSMVRREEVRQEAM